MSSSTSTSLTLRALLKTAADRAGFVLSDRPVGGLTASAKAYFSAAACARNRVLLVTATDAEVEQLTSDARFFLAALEGLSDAEAARVVVPFPSQEVDPYRGLAPHFDIASTRAATLFAMASGAARLVVVSAAALLPRLSAPQRIQRAGLAVRAGMDIAPQDLADRLIEAGYSRQDPTDEPGEFSVRGGVVDFFPAGAQQPVRLEFVGDTIESLRTYDPATQRSTGGIDQAHIVPLQELFTIETDQLADRPATFVDYAELLRPAVIVSEPDEARAAFAKRRDQLDASYEEARLRQQRAPEPAAIAIDWDVVAPLIERATVLETLAIGDDATHHIASQPATEFGGRVADWVAELRQARERGETVVFVANSQGRAERVIEMLGDYDVPASPIERGEDSHHAAVLVAVGHLSKGFRLPDASLQLWAETDVFDEDRHLAERRRSATKTFLSDFRDLKVGDLVVHVDHGIGVFVGLKRIDVGLEPQEFMELRYAGEDKLFVPVERLDLVQKYTGASRPALDRLGGTSWEKAKTRVKKAMRDMAEELLKLYASRKAVPGHAFSADSHWQQEFEDAFEWDLTPDQRTAIADIKRDMETPSPMDRLLCGDVGYGKTEVAMRAAFKAVMDGKQVAVLAPTTVLAFQHLKTLRNRFAAFPVNIDMVSRFRSKAEQKQIVTDMSAGKVEIIVGTHRLLSKDVQFRDLGLLVVDEEQRFGVAHKEKIKQLRKRVDVLTMTATPIPRTLNMSLAGIRDMSIIETPPKDRLSIQTNVVKFDQAVITRAIRNEIERNGQVYFVHNRVESIYSMADLLRRLVPEARIGVGHGQMNEDDLERVMVDFVAHKFDILLATTIIENGLDIPNANTMIINRADRYGLSQLYQLRGRVGRSDRRAYAYLLIPPEQALSAVAKKRLAAIREFSDLGSGFRVAALDLEIRGAGNLLGGEQSGHIEAVGFDMYMKLLEQTIKELKGEEIDDDIRATVNLRVDLRIDESYIPDMNQRLTVYRRMAGSRTEAELDRVLGEVKDRYGAPPLSISNLADYARIRLLADRVGIESIDREADVVVLKFRAEAKLDPQWLLRVLDGREDLQLSPPATLKLNLKARHRPVSEERKAVRGQLRGRMRVPQSSGPPSWWTTRATAGEVTAGFSKEEILKPVAEDPRAENGVFARVTDLLRELSEGVSLR
ncbi:MAG TPA: transcription-repair coupling factor [Vicinamibacterales bacterium]|jgi:transcription-repair coupling factor (superfamily II helicase)|nr:transcription-repair coupling factor [Vicinamibacterales bacterium]